MAKVFQFTLSLSVALLLLSSIGLLQFVTPFTEAAPTMRVVNESVREWRLGSHLTGKLLKVSPTEGSVDVGGSTVNNDTYLVLERVSSSWLSQPLKVKIKRKGTSTYIAVTTDGRLIAINESAVVTESTVFTRTTVYFDNEEEYKFNTTVQYAAQSSPTNHHNTTETRSICNSHLLPATPEDSSAPVPLPTPTVPATCYIAIDNLDTGTPPSNVCDVPGNDFSFEDDNLSFYRYIRYSMKQK